ncbi:Protein of unknown function [Cotesia congregata]|uniref:Uncharacterized protein n=1 Tax=Cotesia congregata TaxID=51543 RepID=A0A8J2HA64_COTCN|nr:Protein of unknown function [Cotesia congregata]
MSQIVASVQNDGRIQFDGSFKRIYLPHMQLVNKDGSFTIMSSQDLLNLNQKLRSGQLQATSQYRIIGLNGFSYILSNHQLQRLANHEVAAIHNAQTIDQPGFGHLFFYIDNSGTLQSFVYDWNLDDALARVSQEGYPNSQSPDSYHHNRYSYALNRDASL